MSTTAWLLLIFLLTVVLYQKARRMEKENEELRYDKWRREQARQHDDD
jgi:hypothetical protein